MIERKHLIEEQLLRKNIRTALKIVLERKTLQEKYIRQIVRKLLQEGPVAKMEYFALNLLGHFIEEVIGNPEKPDADQPFKDSFTDLTSNSEDRELFTEYILDFADEDFKTMDANKEPVALDKSFVDRGFAVEEEEEEIPEEDEIIKISLEDLEEKGGDVSSEPEEPEENFTLGEDGGEEIELEDDENSGIERYSREGYKSIGASLRRWYGQVPKNSLLKKVVEIDGTTYEPGELDERELFRIYFKKNVLLWAQRYESIYFSDTPDVDIDLEAELGEEPAEEPVEEPPGLGTFEI